MRALLAAIGLVLAFAAPRPLQAWGWDVHRELPRRAIEGLPPALRPFYEEQVDFITEHSVDPDLWRVVALRGDLGEEDPNHVLDIDALDEPAPFTGVPRTWDDMVERYGRARANRAGRLPWRAGEIYARLVTMFREIGKPGGPAYAPNNVRYPSAVLAHYLADAHQPLHATQKYDGQLTNQRGIHARWETGLPLRHISSLRLVPIAVHPIGRLWDYVFTAVVRRQLRVVAALDADRAAAAGRERYDDGYYRAFFTAARPLLETTPSESASAVASAIVGAWEEADRPALPLTTDPRPAPISRS